MNLSAKFVLRNNFLCFLYKSAVLLALWLPFNCFNDISLEETFEKTAHELLLMYELTFPCIHVQKDTPHFRFCFGSTTYFLEKIFPSEMEVEYKSLEEGGGSSDRTSRSTEQRDTKYIHQEVFYEAKE